MTPSLAPLLLWLASQFSLNQWLWPVIAVTSSVVLLLVGAYAVVVSVRYQRLEASVVRSW